MVLASVVVDLVALASAGGANGAEAAASEGVLAATLAGGVVGGNGVAETSGVATVETAAEEGGAAYRLAASAIEAAGVSRAISPAHEGMQCDASSSDAA
ncbi:hypothetical protein D0B32_16580 [Paraburkholderia sp. DHOC27]|nr:hypothetical protein D0B32_16580 [Paraburkholderia sp. DHOC27]